MNQLRHHPVLVKVGVLVASDGEGAAGNRPGKRPTSPILSVGSQPIQRSPCRTFDSCDGKKFRSLAQAGYETLSETGYGGQLLVEQPLALLQCHGVPVV